MDHDGQWPPLGAGDHALISLGGHEKQAQQHDQRLVVAPRAEARTARTAAGIVVDASPFEDGQQPAIPLPSASGKPRRARRQAYVPPGGLGCVFWRYRHPGEKPLASASAVEMHGSALKYKGFPWQRIKDVRCPSSDAASQRSRSVDSYPRPPGTTGSSRPARCTPGPRRQRWPHSLFGANGQWWRTAAPGILWPTRLRTLLVTACFICLGAAGCGAPSPTSAAAREKAEAVSLAQVAAGNQAGALPEAACCLTSNPPGSPIRCLT